jgi:hypothetical protein
MGEPACPPFSFEKNHLNECTLGRTLRHSSLETTFSVADVQPFLPVLSFPLSLSLPSHIVYAPQESWDVSVVSCSSGISLASRQRLQRELSDRVYLAASVAGKAVKTSSAARPSFCAFFLVFLLSVPCGCSVPFVLDFYLDKHSSKNGARSRTKVNSNTDAPQTPGSAQGKLRPLREMSERCLERRYRRTAGPSVRLRRANENSSGRHLSRRLV